MGLGWHSASEVPTEGMLLFLFRISAKMPTCVSLAGGDACAPGQLLIRENESRKELNPWGSTLFFDDACLIGGEEVLQVGYLLLQFFSAVGVAHADTVAAEVLEQRAVVDVAAG